MKGLPTFVSMKEKRINYRIERGTRDDVPALLALIRELAAFERQPEAVTATEADFLRDGFGENPKFEFFMARCDGEAVGMAFFYPRYSTWKGATLHLEDLYIVPEHRGTGLAQMLFDAVAQIAAQKEVGRMEWTVLDWNERAIRFYEKNGAHLDPKWILGTLHPDDLEKWKSIDP